jgi:ribosome-associated protein
VTIDLRGRSAMADHMVIASGRNARQVATIAEKLVAASEGRRPAASARIEGKDTGDWVLIDTDDVVVHVFRPEVREFYQLEKMWMPAEALRCARPRWTGCAPTPTRPIVEARKTPELTMRMVIAAVGRLRQGPEAEADCRLPRPARQGRARRLACRPSP